ncbi:MAG: hypothetical protein BWY45_02388 [Euryarchaeota archaeon ADurb.Bin294]|nr:MAG: hypothetical protein BWY45_02388 [Euryarchaeota archaeon ADurb.Bin294]
MSRNIQRDDDIGFYCLLECDGLGIGYLNFAIDRELKRSRVGHNDPVKIQGLCKTISKGTLTILFRPGEDICIGDDRFNAHLLHLFWGYQVQVRVDNRKQGRGFDGLALSGEFSDSSGYVFF